ncbi:hypothetical protein SLEP1_g60414, partial [Rubroshorea leprosula]
VIPWKPPQFSHRHFLIPPAPALLVEHFWFVIAL